MAPLSINSSIEQHSSSSSEANSLRGSFLGYSVFKRTYAAPKTNDETESFADCIQRLCTSSLVQDHCRFSEQDQDLLERFLLSQRCSLSGRYLQSLSRQKGTLPLCSCAFTPIDHPTEPFVLAARWSLNGIGVGYSVQEEHIQKLPFVVPLNVKRVDDANEASLVVDDSREGWIELFKRVLEGFFNVVEYPKNNTFTYSLELLKTSGTESDIASLETALQNVVSVLREREGQKARSIDCMDVMNIICPAVVIGKSRCAALLALGDAQDTDFLRAKRWDLTPNLPLWRCASNNSVVCRDITELPDEFWEGYEGKGEAMGLVNLDLFRNCGRVGDTKYSDPNIMGVSACAEQGLAPGEVSVLAELMLPQFETPEQLWDATRLMYTICKHSLNLDMPEEFSTTKQLAQSHSRMGLGVTGYLQATKEQKSWLSANYNRLRKYDEWYSQQHGLSPSIKLTTVKPSGTISLLSGHTPGCHPGYAPYYIRRMRLDANHALLSSLKEMGLTIEAERGFDGTPNPDRQVVEFPCQSPPGTQLADETSAVQQLEVVQRLQKEWSDSAVSVTVYYRKEELREIQAWLRQNYTDNIKSCSFLLHCDHGFDQAPYETIDRDTYEQMMDSLTKTSEDSL